MDIQKKINELGCVLDLKRRIVGVKFVFTKEEFDNIDVKQVNNKMSYCNTVKFASKGKGFKANIDNFFCKASARALGLMEVDNQITSGKEYYSYRMYNSLGIAKNVQKHVTYIDHKIYGVVVQPLEKFQTDPDIVIMIINPYQAMRIVQGYAYHYGVAKNIQFTGNQGLCSECTATPYEANDLNISLLCANTRFAAKWNENELGIGMPFSVFLTVTDGVLKTINPSEPDAVKKIIMDRAEKQNHNIDIALGTSYYRSGKRR